MINTIIRVTIIIDLNTRTRISADYDLFDELYYMAVYTHFIFELRILMYYQ